jgi:hypothetical protein
MLKRTNACRTFQSRRELRLLFGLATVAARAQNGVRSMKSCTYCGLENEDENTFCQECGTEIVVPMAKRPSKKSLDWMGLKYAVLGAGALFVVAVLYLLSLGPVVRWTGTQAIPVPLVTVTNGNSFTTSFVTSYPAWVDVVYYPALELLASGGGGNLGELYIRYIQWWEKPSKPLTGGIRFLSGLAAFIICGCLMIRGALAASPP